MPINKHGIDTSKIDIGDEVTLTGTVVDIKVSHGRLTLAREGNGYFSYLEPELVTKHVPKPVEIVIDMEFKSEHDKDTKFKVVSFYKEYAMCIYLESPLKSLIGVPIVLRLNYIRECLSHGS